MFEKRVYCMDEPLAKLEKKCCEVDEQSDNLLELIRKLEHDVLHWDAPDKEWNYLLDRLEELEDEAYEHSWRCYCLQRDTFDLVNERTTWRRIPPIKFWRKKES